MSELEASLPDWPDCIDERRADDYARSRTGLKRLRCGDTGLMRRRTDISVLRGKNCTCAYSGPLFAGMAVAQFSALGRVRHTITENVSLKKTGCVEYEGLREFLEGTI